MSLLSLPNEILIIITKQLDYFALLNLSKVDPVFEKFYNDPRNAKCLKVDANYAVDDSWKQLRRYISLFKSNIRYLDLSYVNWIDKANFRISLKGMKELQCLNLIETGICLNYIGKSLNILKNLKSVAVSFFHNEEYPIEELLYVKDLILVLHDIMDIPGMITYLTRLNGMSQVHVKIKVMNSLFIHTPVNISSWIWNSNFSSVQLVNYGYKCKLVKYFGKVDLKFYEYVCIETPSTIFVNKNFSLDDEQGSLVRNFNEILDQEDKEDIILSIYGIAQGNESVFKEYLSDKIKVKMSKQAVVPYMEFSNLESIYVNHLKNTTTYKDLLFTQHHLLKPAAIDKKQSNGIVFKKAKISHIPEAVKNEPSILQEVLASNKEVISLDVKDYSSPMDTLHHKRDFMCDWNSLHSITALKHLKYLTMTIFPYNCNIFAKELFQNCKCLQSFQASSDVFVQVEPFAEHIHLSQSIRVVNLKTCFRKVNYILEKLSAAPSLHTIGIWDKKNITGKSEKEKISIGALTNLINKCDKLVHLYAYQDMIPTTWVTIYRKFEKTCRAKSKKLHISLNRRLFFVQFNYWY